MKSTRKTTTISHEIEGFVKEIEFTTETIMENDGIGAYEFWGQKCYDAGTWYARVDGDITWDRTKYYWYQNQDIAGYVAFNEDTLCEAFENQRNQEENDYDYHDA